VGREKQLLDILNDGTFHSGEALAQVLGVSRAAVWKLVRVLQRRGIRIQAVRGRGYCLPEPVELLDQARITAELQADVRSLIGEIEIHQSIDSTNTYLLSRAKDGLVSGSVCLAELQLSGRGRHGRRWISPYAANLYLSLLWRFPREVALLSGLSLVTGIAVARALRGLGITEAGLKWPNDVLWRHCKLGGVLLEFGGESLGSCYVVAGVGLNVAMPKGVGSAIDQPWVDLHRILGPTRISRNRLATQVLSEMVQSFAKFEREGFKTISEEWAEFDLVAGRRVSLKLPTKTITGIAHGVDESGALLLTTPTGVERFIAGEISLRLSE